MKILLCTGDSHTQGQGQDTFFDPFPEKPIKSYDLVNGTGLGFRRLYDSNCYVNLIRHYLYEKTGSMEEEVQVGFLEELKGEVIFDCEGSDMFVFTFAEGKEETFVNVYTDGEFYRRIRFFTPCPRWDDWSARDLKIMCSGKKEIKFVLESGRVRFVSGRKYTGTHAVINCGIGSCNCKSFTDWTLSQLIEDFEPYMFIAEAHTINDWISGKTVEEYKEHLGTMLDIMTKNSQHTVLMTVSPVLGPQKRSGFEAYNTADYYDNYVNASREAAMDRNIPIVDANEEFKKRLKGLPEEEMHKEMYKDVWHVNSKGHKIYAEEIIKEVEALL
ncbi:MAG: hypothetical protein IKV27_02760 [Lachnospiraceae bacterium]|nr:hypothetical protein [Lachnospiraceae bacterium]